MDLGVRRRPRGKMQEDRISNIRLVWRPENPAMHAHHRPAAHIAQNGNQRRGIVRRIKDIVIEREQDAGRLQMAQGE